MKRATLLLEDELYRRAKSLAKKNNTSLKEVINQLLREGLSHQCKKYSLKPQNVQLPLYSGRGPIGGVDVSDRNSLYEIMDRKKK